MTKDDQVSDSLVLLLKMAELGELVTASVKHALGGIAVTDNVSLLVLAQLKMYGPLRPSDIAESTGLTSGGVTKVLTRLEDLGLVLRRHGAFPQDGRAVEVSLTESGSIIVRTFGTEFARQIAEASDLIEAMYLLANQVTGPRTSS